MGDALVSIVIAALAKRGKRIREPEPGKIRHCPGPSSFTLQVRSGCVSRVSMHKFDDVLVVYEAFLMSEHMVERW